jgi:hypothetical protein
MPGHRSAGHALIEHVLKTCREANMESIIAWLSENDFRFTDILSSFTFEPRRVRMKARALLREEPDTARSGSFRITDSGEADQKELSTAFMGGRGDARDLADIVGDIESSWQTVFTAISEQSVPIVIGQLSSSDRRLALVHVNEPLVMGEPSATLSPELVKGVLARLYHSGVREVRCEVDSDTRIKVPLLSAGFVPDLTMFQFVIELAQTATP